MPSEWAIGVLVTVLSVSCLVVVITAAYLLCRFSRQLSLPAELAMRFPYRVDPDHYAAMGYGDALGAARAGTDAALPIHEKSTPVEPISDDAVPTLPAGYVPTPEELEAYRPE